MGKTPIDITPGGNVIEVLPDDIVAPVIGTPVDTIDEFYPTDKVEVGGTVRPATPGDGDGSSAGSGADIVTANDGYIFRWESQNGTTRVIRITPKTDFSGNYLKRALGSAPVLRYEHNDCIIGTSLEFSAECVADQEFRKLYTSSPYEYDVQLFDQDDTLQWQGFLVPEMYSEPDIAPPYDVALIATDGIGELKQAKYSHGADRLIDILATLLHPAQDRDLDIFSRMNYDFTRTGAVDDVNFLVATSMDLSDRNGDTCYDVLQDVLRTFHLTIVYGPGFMQRRTESSYWVFNPGWYVFNPNDLRTVSGGPLFRINASTQAHEVAPVTFGHIGSQSWWPVGQLESGLRPAYNSATVSGKAEYKELIKNSEFANMNGWMVTGSATRLVRRDGVPYIRLWRTRTSGALGTLKQTVDLHGTVEEDIQLTVKCNGRGQLYTSGTTPAGLVDGSLGFTIEGRITKTGSSYYGQGPFYLQVNDTATLWKTGSAIENVKRFPASPLSVEPQELTVDIPLSDDGLFGSPAAARDIDTFVITFFSAGSDSTTEVLGVHMEVSGDTRTKDLKVNVTNGARSAQNTVDLLVPYISTGEDRENIRYFLKHVPYYTGTGLGRYAWGAGSDKDFQTFMCTEYAKEYALPRIEKSGKLNVPAGAFHAPLLLEPGSGQAFRFLFLAGALDLYNDELDLAEVVEVPSGQIAST